MGGPVLEKERIMSSPAIPVEMVMILDRDDSIFTAKMALSSIFIIT